MKKKFGLLVASLLIAGTLFAGGAAVVSEKNVGLAENRTGTYTVNEKSPLYQKSALFVGDSICAAGCELNDPVYGETMGWAGRIGAANGMEWTNASASGASYSTCRPTNRIITQIENAKDASYDIVVLQGGVNDAWDFAPLGSIGTGIAYEAFDQDTFAGAFEAAVCKVREYFPDSTVGYIVNFRTPKAEAEWGITGLNDENTVKYFDMAKKICDKWGVPYLDLYEDEALNNDKLQVNTKNFLSDYVHPNSAGYNILSPIIERWMEVISDKSTFKTVQNASIRYGDPCGLRFCIAMTEERKTAVLSNPSQSVGMFIFPEFYLPANEDYSGFDFAGLSKKLTVEFSEQDFYTNSGNDKLSGMTGAWVRKRRHRRYVRSELRNRIRCGRLHRHRKRRGRFLRIFLLFPFAQCEKSGFGRV